MRIGSYVRKVVFTALFLMCAIFASYPAAAAELNLPDLDGKIVSLSDHKGKVIILDFFATWCPPCKQEIPDFVALQKEYGPEGFTVIGVSLSQAPDTHAFARKLGINYPVLIENGSAEAIYGPVRAMPTTLVLDHNLKVVKQYIGYRPKEVFEADIKALLQSR